MLKLDLRLCGRIAMCEKMYEIVSISAVFSPY